MSIINHLGGTLGSGTMRSFCGFYTLLGLLAAVLLSHLRTLDGRLGEELGTKMLTTATLLIFFGSIAHRRIGCLVIQNLVDKFLRVETLGLGNAHLFGNADQFNVGFGC